ncbi:homeobox domain-containing protein [Phanerochaete sordida]|uniref:Homeobox domain-containing protein n=1 Tax=Phanerochaete sordida TaxID=48140 RepID=A0A9P3LJI6_9APHY|nr:homeobox domain-containing protein [Phanerochaete sordida]
MEPSNSGHDNIFSSPPSLHASSLSPPSVYHSPDDLSRLRRHPALDSYESQMAHAHHQQNQREHSTTYVPSLVPPGVDPSQVDVRTFYPYQPNEVKHRKRTTRSQLKILEDVYKYDKKPNASLRKKLADELTMTPRGVQVWFQNRRAKEKNLARKAEQARDGVVPVKKPLALNASAAPESPSAAPESSSPTPVSSKPSKAAETSSSSRASPGSTATPPPASSAASSSSPPAGSTSQSGDSGAQEDDEYPFLQSPPSREASVPSGYLSSTPTPSAAELLAQRRPSLPILSITPSASSSSHPPVRTTRASIHVGGGGSGLLSVSNGQSPHGFDPAMRRRSVDNNIKRLGAHPYAHLARGTNDRFHAANPSHLHSLAPAPTSDAGRLDTSTSRPGPIGFALRHGSMPHVLAPMDIPVRLQRRGNAMQEYAGFSTGDMAPPRPTLAHKHSLPAFQTAHDFRLSSRSVSSGQPGSLPIFTNPNPFGAPALSSAPPAFYDAPVSPLAPGAQPPPSPSAASPPPIAQSLTHGAYAHLHVPLRAVAPPPEGPLPEPSFSFGHASGSPSPALSSAASSPPSDHSTVVDGGREYGGRDEYGEYDGRGEYGAREEYGEYGAPARRDSADSASSGAPDDASLGSSAYDSRFGSLTSASSWTSYCSEPADAQKPELESFDPARRGSFASTYLPQLLNGLEVTDAGAPQAQYADGVPPDQLPHAGSRRGSLAPPDAPYAQHMPDVYPGPHAYLAHAHENHAHEHAAYRPPAHHVPYPATDQDPYARGDVYAQMGKDGMADVRQGEGRAGFEMRHVCASSSSELAYALHPQGSMQSSGPSRFAGYQDSMDQGNSHAPPAPEQAAQFDASSAAKAAHYGQEAYEQQATPYDSLPPDQQAYPEQQQQPAYDEQQLAYPEQQPYFYGYQGTAMNEAGAMDLGSMCVPASLMIGGVDYSRQYS